MFEVASTIVFLCLAVIWSRHDGVDLLIKLGLIVMTVWGFSSIGVWDISSVLN